MNHKLLITVAASFALFSSSLMGSSDANATKIKPNPSASLHMENIQKCLEKKYPIKIQQPKTETSETVKKPNETKESNNEQNTEKPKQEQNVEAPKQEKKNDIPKQEQNVEIPKQEEKVPEVQQPVQKPTVPNNQNEEQPKEQPTSYSLNAFEQQVVDLTNQERAKQGLAPLKVDIELSKVAREKSKDMAINNYFSHTSPTYGSPFDMMKKFGISYTAAGENIAKGQRSPQEVVNAWMNSSGHRANILNPNFTHIGVGFVDQGYIWTQQFIKK